MQSITKGLLQLPAKFPNKKILSIDIGGNLAKTAFYIPKSDPQFQDHKSFEILTKDTIPKLSNGEMIYLKSFPSTKIHEFIKFAKQHKLIDKDSQHIHATGGGAYKYNDLFEEEFGQMGVQLKKHDEMESLVNGMSFILNYGKEPAFKYIQGEGKKYLPRESTTQFPKLLISIGSGVSIIKVNNFNSFERVSGTMIGGGTLLGLANLLTGINDFDTILEMSKRGDNNNVDMLVRDIYGDKSPFKDLKGDLLASSFAKVAFDNEFDGNLRFDDISGKYKKEDILNSLVFMISFNIGQLAYMTGQLHQVDQMYFIGNYVRGHDLAMERINFAVEFMSQQKTQAQFLTYDGYLGAIGAFMKEFENDTN
ncbi:UNKNOWN [Stylonychia lemnae]|uniref:Pantothenate kinase n=1 Tax=Stylonychia lemnae TaxID=5949 RepID=A0A078AA02_STYLE|nr:UNKNOWN [Stylonychia lemnae]|eukprot:CDW79019.1 UNKNOWN [Stylonychia lemnae]